MISFLLRRFAEFKAGRRASQLIMFEGASEVQRGNDFSKGVVVGAIAAAGLIMVAAPGGADANLLEEVERQRLVAQAATERAEQAGKVAELCVKTASSMDQTLKSYQGLLAE